MSINAAPEQAFASDDFVLARQPIVDRDGQLYAFELLFRTLGEVREANVIDHAGATAAVISHASQLGMEQVVGAQLAFVNIDAVVLMSDFVRFLAPDRVVLEILETVPVTPGVAARVAELVALGFKFALDDVVADSDQLRRIASLIEVIKVDLRAVDPVELPALVRALRRTNCKLLAEKVETQDEFNHCMALGFDYFQGYYFAKPVILRGKKIAPAGLTILNVLNLINSDEDDRAILLAVKRDALIAMNLLRMVNTPAAGGRGHFDSLAGALIVLGRRQLQRWLQILLYATPDGAVRMTSPLLQMAVCRGKLIELMALKLAPERGASPDIGFTVGIMSLMEVLLSMPMRDILDTVSVADEVRAALLERTGDFGVMLNIAESLENATGGAPLAEQLRLLDLTPAELREIEREAFEWVGELAQELR
jgi:EAL and modified HD-GYP domain-containing signal transduction protein